MVVTANLPGEFFPIRKVGLNMAFETMFQPSGRRLFARSEVTKMQWRFILPLPPSINHQYTERDGRWVLSREARHYKGHLARAFRRLKASGKLAWSVEQGAGSAKQGVEREEAMLLSEEISLPALGRLPQVFLQLRLEFFFKTAQRRDLDNGLKIVQDLVCEALGIDDRNVVQVELVKRVDAHNPRLEVTVIALSSWDFTPAPTAPNALDLRPYVPPLPSRRSTRRSSRFNLAEWLLEHLPEDDALS